MEGGIRRQNIVLFGCWRITSTLQLLKRMRGLSFQALRRGIPFRSLSRCTPFVSYRPRVCPSHVCVPYQSRSPEGSRGFSCTPPARFGLEGDSTIYALSTAAGRAAIAVVRVSGPACVEVHTSPPIDYAILMMANQFSRFTILSAPEHPFPNRALRRFARSTIQTNPPPAPTAY